MLLIIFRGLEMNISFGEFMKLEIIIAKILEVEKMPKTDKLFKIIVDVGNKKTQVIGGGAEFYNEEELKGKKVVLLANLEPRIIRGERSEGMLLAAEVGDKPYWLTVEEDVPPGSKVR